MFNTKLKSILYISDQGVRDAFELFNCKEIFISIRLKNQDSSDRNYGIRLHDDGTREIFHDKISNSLSLYCVIRNTCKSDNVLVLNDNEFWYNRITGNIREIYDDREYVSANGVFFILIILVLIGFITLI